MKNEIILNERKELRKLVLSTYYAVKSNEEKDERTRQHPRDILELLRRILNDKGSSIKKCLKGILEPWIFAMEYEDKNYFCANFQDVWSSSKSWKLDIKNAISSRKLQV